MKDVEDHTYQILIVEDDEVYRQSLKDCLDGHQRITANNCHDGLERFKEYCPNITFLDITLTDGSGLDLLSKMREYDPEAFIVMTTQSTLKQDVDKATKRGAAGYVIKPFNRKKIRAYFHEYEEHLKALGRAAPEERLEHIQKHLKVERPAPPAAIKESDTSEPQQERTVMTELSNTLHNFKILFVDDYHKNRINARKHISKLGCHVDLAEDDDEALALLKTGRHHVLFLSTNAKGKNPYQLVQEIRDHDKEKMVQPFIVGMSNSVEEVQSKRWLHAGMDNCIAKPYSFSKIEEMVLHYAREYQNEVVLSQRYAHEESYQAPPPVEQEGDYKDYLENVRSALSHVLRDPLRNALHLLEQEGNADTIKDNITDVLTNMDALNHYAHLCQEAPRKESVDTGALIAHIIQEGGYSSVQYDPRSFPVLQANKEQLQHIFNTLIDNGLTFNHHDNPSIDITVAKETDGWIFTVRDNGIGLDDVYEKLIARPFTRITPEEHEDGKGMNLALAKVMVINHGGTLTFHSEGEDEGTAFYVTLPL